MEPVYLGGDERTGLDELAQPAHTRVAEVLRLEVIAPAVFPRPQQAFVNRTVVAGPESARVGVSSSSGSQFTVHMPVVVFC